MSTPERSRLPWSYEMYELSTGDSAIMYDARGLGVPGMSRLNEHDAAIIVTAVNSHATLLAAAKFTVLNYDGLVLLENEVIDLRTLKAAIAAAEEPAPPETPK